MVSKIMHWLLTSGGPFRSVLGVKLTEWTTLRDASSRYIYVHPTEVVQAEIVGTKTCSDHTLTDVSSGTWTCRRLGQQTRTPSSPTRSCLTATSQDTPEVRAGWLTRAQGLQQCHCLQSKLLGAQMLLCRTSAKKGVCSDSGLDINSHANPDKVIAER